MHTNDNHADAMSPSSLATAPAAAAAQAARPPSAVPGGVAAPQKRGAPELENVADNSGSTPNVGESAAAAAATAAAAAQPPPAIATTASSNQQQPAKRLKLTKRQLRADPLYQQFFKFRSELNRCSAANDCAGAVAVFRQLQANPAVKCNNHMYVKRCTYAGYSVWLCA